MERLAVRLMIAQAALFAAETAVIHRIGVHGSVTLLAFVRGAGGLVLAMLLARQSGVAVMRTSQLGLQLGRGVVSLAYLWVMIYSFGHLPFADATAISYTQSAYIAVFSVLILGEAIPTMRWVAAVLGIVGAILIAKPATGGWSSLHLMVLAGTSLNGLAFVLNRYLQRKDNEKTTMFYTNLVCTLGAAPAAFMTTLPPTGTLICLPALFVLGPLGMYAGIVALKHASASALGPYTLLRLVIALVGGAVLFGELPEFLSLGGATLILASCLLSSWAPKQALVARGSA